MSAEEQTKRVADYIMFNVPGEPSQDEGAGDCAIRLLKEYQAVIRKYQEQVECAPEDYEEQLSKHRAAFTMIMRELGVPNESYPSSIANAYEIAKAHHIQR